MMERASSPAERETYSTYVVPKSPLGDAAVRAFAGNSPPVSNAAEVDMTSGAARDSANGRRVKTWDAKVLELDGDRAVVAVDWYSANLASGVHVIELAWREGKWVFVKQRTAFVS